MSLDFGKVSQSVRMHSPLNKRSFYKFKSNLKSLIGFISFGKKNFIFVLPSTQRSFNNYLRLILAGPRSCLIFEMSLLYSSEISFNIKFYFYSS